MLKKSVISLFLFLLPMISIFSQSNELLDQFFSREKADFKSSLWLVYLSAELLDLEASPEEAMEYLQTSSYIAKYESVRDDSLIKYKDFAFLMMNSFDLPGGLFYNMFKLPRYAAREFTYRKWMPGSPKPESFLTPWQVSTSISQIMQWKEAQQ